MALSPSAGQFDLAWLRDLVHPTTFQRTKIHNDSVRYFKCPEGLDHVFVARPTELVARGQAHACPCCALKQVCSTNSVATTHPTVAAEWHPTKNAKHVPSAMETLSTAKAAIWFQCSKDQRHEWRAIVANRCAGEPCPFCSGAVAAAYVNIVVRLGHSVVNYFWNSKKNRVKPEEVLSGARVAIELKDPLTGTEWTTTPVDFCQVAENSTFPNAIEAIYASFVDRSKRTRALRLVTTATDIVEQFVADIVVHELLARETGYSDLYYPDAEQFEETNGGVAARDQLLPASTTPSPGLLRPRRKISAIFVGGRSMQPLSPNPTAQSSPPEPSSPPSSLLDFAYPNANRQPRKDTVASDDSNTPSGRVGRTKSKACSIL